MKSATAKKRIQSYFKYFRHRYRCLLFVVIGVCSLITLILFLCESDSSIRMSFAIERSSHKSLRKPTFPQFSITIKQLSGSDYRQHGISDKELEYPLKRSSERRVNTNLTLLLSIAQDLYTDSSKGGPWPRSCEKLFTDETVNTTEDNLRYESINSSTSSFKHRLVHFDLKGAPPKMDYFKKILPFLKDNGATGILLEYEDTFPFQGELASIAAPNAYCISEIQELVKLAEDLKLEVIPLVQTFGHMEFVLKEEEFQDLRESNMSTAAICPSQPRSFQLVTEIIDQVMDLHPQARWLHIGCDEVFHLAVCKLCNKHQYHKDTLYLGHVSKVAQYVRTKYNVIPIIWDDMIRRTSSRVLKAINIGNLVEPMVWVYAEDVPSLFFPSMWRRYRMIFKNVWAASAFKGAFGRSIVVPNAKRHLRNHISWLKVKNSPGIKMMNFQGLVLTGWQRYEHFGPLCELLPVGLPSLMLNLLTVSHGTYSQHIHWRFRKAMNCSLEAEEMASLTEDPFLKHTMKSCNFPGSPIFNLAQNVRVIIKKLNIIGDSLCHCKHDNNEEFSSEQNDHYLYQFSNCLGSLRGLGKALSTALATVFDGTTVSEWIQQNVSPLSDVVKTLVATSQNRSLLITLCNNNCTRTRVPRIFPKMSNDEYDLERCLQSDSYKLW